MSTENLSGTHESWKFSNFYFLLFFLLEVFLRAGTQRFGRYAFKKSVVERATFFRRGMQIRNAACPYRLIYQSKLESRGFGSFHHRRKGILGEAFDPFWPACIGIYQSWCHPNVLELRQFKQWIELTPNQRITPETGLNRHQTIYRLLGIFTLRIKMGGRMISFNDRDCASRL